MIYEKEFEVKRLKGKIFTQGHTQLMAELGLDQGFLSDACIFYVGPLSVPAPVVLGLVC